MAAFFFFFCFLAKMALPSHSHSVGGGWSCYDAQIPPSTEKNLKILSFTTSLISQPARPQSSRVSSKALSLLCHLSARPPSLSHLSLSRSTLSFASHSLSYPPLLVIFPYSASLSSPGWIFVFMRALGLRCYLL